MGDLKNRPSFLGNQPKLRTAREWDDIEHWAATGKGLTAVLIIGCGLYVLAACLGWVS